MTYLAVLWSAPLQIGLSTYFLYNLLGVSTFAGIALMVVMSPINGLITRCVLAQDFTADSRAESEANPAGAWSVVTLRLVLLAPVAETLA
jgi:hypothetical protein